MSDQTTTKEGNIMIYNTADDLHTLLDSLKDGEHVKATWVVDNHEITVKGPVTINETVVCDSKTIKSEGPVTIKKMIWCDRPIRWENGEISIALASVEVARDEDVTVTRDDVVAIHNLLDSLNEGETVTADWGTVEGAMSITGKVRAHGLIREVGGYGNCGLRERNGVLHHFLRSVTVRRTVVKRWEREGDE